MKKNHPTNKTIVLQIEIDAHLYFGVCDWDEETKTSPKKDKDNEPYVLTNSNRDLEEVSFSDFYYWWEYLPDELKEKVNYENADGEFESLFDRETFEKYIDDVCRKIEMFMDEWNR